MEDGFRDGFVAIKWSPPENLAVLTLRASSNDFSAKAALIYRGSEQIMFITRHGLSEPYLYSYFCSPRTLTRHCAGSPLSGGNEAI